MTVLEDPSAFIGVVLTKQGRKTEFFFPPEKVLKKRKTFGPYVWLVQGYQNARPNVPDTLVPILCSTCYTVALQEAIRCFKTRMGVLHFTDVSIHRLSRLGAEQQDHLRHPSVEDMEELVEKAMQLANKPKRRPRTRKGNPT